jgi:hypothetical protein
LNPELVAERKRRNDSTERKNGRANIQGKLADTPRVAAVTRDDYHVCKKMK